MSVKILIGDSLTMLKTLEDQSVHCVVTSPPYWGLRDYGVAGQLGLEKTPQEFIANMVEVFREVRRVLRDDGTCWVNMGDSYAGSGRGGNSDAITGAGKDESKRSRHDVSDAQRQNCPTVRGSRLPAGLHADQVNAGAIGRAWVAPPAGLKAKDLCGMPWRLAFALQDDGWYLRQDIIWSKPNPMPESVRDRCTKAHEYIFLLSKSERYFYDQEAICEPASLSTHARLAQNVQDQIGSDRVPGKTNGPMKAVSRAKQSDDANVVDGDVSARFGRGPGWRRKLAEANSGTKNNSSFDAAMAIMPLVRNKRSVWTMNTQGFSEAHFATFPPELPETCIKAGCPLGGVVLDPFFGAGTTGLVADRLGRDCIGIELNPEYAEMARRRILGDSPLFAEVA